MNDGSLIIEYSKDEIGEYYKRLFYSLKKDGRNYFSDDSPIKYFEAYNPIDNNFNGRFESINKIVYLSNDINKEKEFLFSVSSWTTVIELHDIKENVSKYWDSQTFLEDVIYSYYIIILDLPENNENHYLIIYNKVENDKIHFDNQDRDYTNTYSIKKFKFNSFNDYSIINKTNYFSSYYSRVVSFYCL